MKIKISARFFYINFNLKMGKKIPHKITCADFNGAGNPVPDIYAQKVIVLEVA